MAKSLVFPWATPWADPGQTLGKPPSFLGKPPRRVQKLNRKRSILALEKSDRVIPFIKLKPENKSNLPPLTNPAPPHRFSRILHGCASSRILHGHRLWLHILRGLEIGG